MTVSFMGKVEQLAIYYLLKIYSDTCGFSRILNSAEIAQNLPDRFPLILSIVSLRMTIASRCLG